MSIPIPAFRPSFSSPGTGPSHGSRVDSLYVFAMLSLSLSFNFIEEIDFLNVAARTGYEKAAWLFPVYPDEELPFDEAKKLIGAGAAQSQHALPAAGTSFAT